MALSVPEQALPTARREVTSAKTEPSVPGRPGV
jgi:hypothetical protein